MDADINNHGINSASNSFHVFDFTGGMKLLIPMRQKTTEAIMDGALKDIKTALKEFAETYCCEEILEDNQE